MAGRNKYIVTIGQVFGAWTVIDIPPLYVGSPKALCECECGNKKEVSMRSLLEMDSRSCGCKRSSSGPSDRNHGYSGTRIYKIWLEMRRVHKNKRKRVELCKDWRDSFMAFKNWADLTGYTDNHTLVRIDTKYGHEPENCYWEENE